MKLIELFNMGDYGIYVWSAYFVTLFIFGINLFITFKEKNKVKKMVSEYLFNKKAHKSS